MKVIYIILGFVCLGLGIIGIPTPGLPGTPFLLLALFFFTKGSDRVHAWFIQTDIYRNHVQPFEKNRSLTVKAKAYILAFATITLLIGFYFSPLIGKIVIAILLVVKYWFFFFWIKTAPPVNATQANQSPDPQV
ncbi:hypothetical protein EDC44_10189 [Cricetibacter osteomyelitidis]|uniref:Inner membrane protein n=1 Tax=Cricetibacter osteomyelitidis TaxID=1521931 RepID=A0A4R2T812_9PAST|nr:YbaN family protein [Cricetibacter osteomyelitidis]TCP97706.1 hypothetical protein EDC44_10189 [Cricetibacter osteomyelitidis]